MKLRGSRIVWLLIHVGLVLFSSTRFAGQASEYAFGYYRSFFDLTASGAGLHDLAQKGMHFVLFFALGVILCQALVSVRPSDKLIWVVVACFVVGFLSEALQSFYPGRQASLLDVALNGISGSVGGSLSASINGNGRKATVNPAL